MATRFRSFEPGTKVRLSGKFLRSTGQLTGAAGLSSWTVLAPPNRFGWVLVNEPSSEPFAMYSDDERRADPRLFWRRIAAEHLVIVGQLDSRNCP
jgi:hypothetical protein